VYSKLGLFCRIKVRIQNTGDRAQNKEPAVRLGLFLCKRTLFGIWLLACLLALKWPDSSGFQLVPVGTDAGKSWRHYTKLLKKIKKKVGRGIDGRNEEKILSRKDAKER